jgi:DNA-binding beta-propeller fold protein YncE
MKTHANRLVLVLAPLVLACFTLIVFLLLTPTSSASPDQAAVPAAEGYWVITTNFSDTNVYIVNTADNTVHGPFLEGQLGSLGGLLDVAVTPDGRTALMSNFGDQAVYFIDLSDPTSPTLNPALPVSVTLPMFAEDIAITHDGRFALVTDGMFASIIASIDIVARTVVYTLDMNTITPTSRAQAIAVAPNGTVVYADYWAGEEGAALIDASGHLTHTGVYSYVIGDYLPWPTNVGIAPDGQTVIICDAFTSAVGIYQITAPGVLSHTGIVTGLLSDVFTGTSPGAQSVAFNAAGDKAYVVLNGRQDGSGALPDQLAVLDITGPGRVSLNTASAVTLPRTTSGVFFGVDVIAVAGDKAYVGYPTTSMTDTNPLAAVTLTDLSAIPLDVGGCPVGVATIPPRRVFLPLIFRNHVVALNPGVKD